MPIRFGQRALARALDADGRDARCDDHAPYVRSTCRFQNVSQPVDGRSDDLPLGVPSPHLKDCGDMKHAVDVARGSRERFTVGQFRGHRVRASATSGRSGGLLNVALLLRYSLANASRNAVVVSASAARADGTAPVTEAKP